MYTRIDKKLINFDLNQITSYPGLWAVLIDGAIEANKDSRMHFKYITTRKMAEQKFLFKLAY
ncbi:hypothetical protein MCETWHM1_01033 [Candidatus Methylopumilus planktonicus]|jgi:hypothetical protein